jgi:hypothetical protein
MTPARRCRVGQGRRNILGAPPIHVRYQELGLKESGPDRVGGPTGNFGPRPVFLDSGWFELRRAAKATDLLLEQDPQPERVSSQGNTAPTNCMKNSPPDVFA